MRTLSNNKALDILIDIYATREEKDDSDECEVAHEQSEGEKIRKKTKDTQAKKVFLPETKHSKNFSQNIRQRQYCINCRLSQR